MLFVFLFKAKIIIGDFYQVMFWLEQLTKVYKYIRRIYNELLLLVVSSHTVLD